jgi:hypothetical protein
LGLGLNGLGSAGSGLEAQPGTSLMVISPKMDAEILKLRAMGNLRKNDVLFRASIAKQLFDTMPQEEHAGFAVCAKANKVEAVRKYKAVLAAPYSTAPEDRQRFVICLQSSSHQSFMVYIGFSCINLLVEFLIPLMEGIRDLTGCKPIFLAGGPMFRLKGEIGAVQ